METQLEEKVLENIPTSLDSIESFYGPAYSLAVKLRENGYEIAGHMGIKINKKKKPNRNFLGILEDRKPLQKNFLGVRYLKYNLPQRAYLLATLWFNDEKRKADENKLWILEVRRKEYLNKLTKLVNALSEPYNVKVKVKLKSDGLVEEKYLSDILS